MYGLIVKNPCKQTAMFTKFDSQAFDKSGRPVKYNGKDGTPLSDSPRLSVLDPGQQVGVSGEFINGRGGFFTATRVASIKAKVSSAEWHASAHNGELLHISTHDVVVGKRDRHGNAMIRFTIDYRPKSLTEIQADVDIIVRDDTGKIISGYHTGLDYVGKSGGTTTSEVWVPDLAGLRAEVYASAQN